MAAYETVREYEIKRSGWVESVTVRRTSDEQYPSGWSYALHFGRTDRRWHLRYDNAHESTKGHERHTHESTDEIDFPGMLALFDRFQAEIDPHRPDDWPPSQFTEE